MLDASMIPILIQGFGESLYMTFASSLLAYALGLPIGVLLAITEAGGLWPKKWLNGFLGLIVNVLRSVPFLILMVALIPLTRLLLGTSIGTTAAVVSLVVASAPFIGRLVEGSIKEIDPGVIEAMQSMGATNWQIITKAMLPEALPSLISGWAVATTAILSYSAIGGAIGAGGLGAIAINYGYYRYKTDIMLITTLVLVIMVQLIQVFGNGLERRMDRRGNRASAEKLGFLAFFQYGKRSEKKREGESK